MDSPQEDTVFGGVVWMQMGNPPPKGEKQVMAIGDEDFDLYKSGLKAQQKYQDPVLVKGGYENLFCNGLILIREFRGRDWPHWTPVLRCYLKHLIAEENRSCQTT